MPSGMELRSVKVHVETKGFEMRTVLGKLIRASIDDRSPCRGTLMWGTRSTLRNSAMWRQSASVSVDVDQCCLTSRRSKPFSCPKALNRDGIIKHLHLNQPTNPRTTDGSNSRQQAMSRFVSWKKVVEEGVRDACSATRQPQDVQDRINERLSG